VAPFSITIAQVNNEVFYLFKSDWSPAKNIDKAAYFEQVVKENDTIYACRYYSKNGPMIKQESFRDDKLEIPNGVFLWYAKSGKLDSMGYVYNGKKDGEWKYFDGKNSPIIITKYNKGRFVDSYDYSARKIYHNDGTVKNMDVPRVKDTGAVKIFTVVQSPAEFEGGLKGWQQYLIQNMKTPDRFINLAGRGGTNATDIVTFEIDKTGSISNVILLKSCEWSVDMEALRVIKQSPKWKPAVQNGRTVIYRHVQNLTFSVRTN
jgi:protein TonB